MSGVTGVRMLSTGLSAHRVRASKWFFQEDFLSLGLQKRPAPLRLSGCASNSRGKDSNAVSENAVDCENTEPVAGWVVVDVGGTRPREVLFCGSEVALDSDVAVLAAGSDIGKTQSDFGKEQFVAGETYAGSCTDSHCCLLCLTNHNRYSEPGNTKAYLEGTGCSA